MICRVIGADTYNHYYLLSVMLLHLFITEPVQTHRVKMICNVCNRNRLMKTLDDMRTKDSGAV